MVPYKEKLGVLIFVAGLFLVLGISVLILSAQSDRGTITGTVSDPTGAAMVGVSVTATNTGTGINSNTTTGPNGSYTITLLPVGIYQVNAEHPRFKKFVANGTVVQIGQTALVDIGMQLGEVSETLQVRLKNPFLVLTPRTWEPSFPENNFWICR